MGNSFQNRRFCQIETKRWVILVGVVAVTYVLFQSLLLPYGNALRSLFPDVEGLAHDRSSFLSVHSSAKSVMVRNPLTVDASDVDNGVVDVAGMKDPEDSDAESDVEDEDGIPRENGEINVEFVSEEKGAGDVLDFVVDKDEQNHFVDEDAENEEKGSFVEETGETDARDGIHIAQFVTPNDTVSNDNIREEDTSLRRNESRRFASTASPASNANLSFGISNDGFVVTNSSETKKKRSEMPPKSITTIDEMNRLLRRQRASSRAMRPRWSSVRDKEIIAVKSKIENAPIVVNDRELYAPLFRNVSVFKRSYELMERTLKVYVYREGNKPIFHQPILKGLYASEGWFMKLMEGNKRFLVKDPRRAHLFYMPFSSRMLGYTLYVKNSHNRTNLRQFMKEYTEKISAKYPFFNRTGGADHFLAACHDWAPYETRHHMERCMKALCNADVTAGFKIGRDVSLPETYVRSARNPLRDLGGQPASKRRILAFYAGNFHGYLRPILLKHWQDKSPDMRILGPMPPGVASKMNYIQHMKTSKYCICPKGYEVNSPRVVESIFYECVPVIISDNFVPPFFEVLNWEAFSLILAEKDIPRLRDILMSITDEKYQQLQLGVRRAQQHFLWHAEPLRYDLFHMTLHSIWFNRVFQVKLR